jgi:hypothetical protein
LLISCSVSTPKLDNVKGAFNLQSSGQLNDTCDFYKDLHSKKLIQSKDYTCEGTLIDPGTQGHDGTKQSGSGDKKGAATSLSPVNGALGLAAMVAVLFF